MADLPRTVLVVASAGHPIVQPLIAALADHGFAGVHCSQVSQAVLALSKPAGRPEQAVLLDDLPGMALPLLARTLRALPGQAHLPLLADADPPLAMELCQALQRPLQSAAVAAQVAHGGPDRSDAAPPEAPCLDPVPLRRIERISPGTAREIVGVVLGDLATARAGLPRWFAEGDLARLAGSAHKLRGSTGSVGAMETAAALGRLEHAARDGDREACKALVEEAIQAIARAEPALAAFVKPG